MAAGSGIARIDDFIETGGKGGSPTSSSKRSNCAFTEVEVAERLGLSVATLRAWRHRGKGPRFVRFGRAVRYLLDDLEDFIIGCRVDTNSSSSATVADTEEMIRG